MAQEKGPLTEKEYLDALEKNHRLSRAEGIDAVLREHRLDAIVAPTGSPPWTIDLINGDNYLGSSSQPAAVAGYPSISIPAGYVFGLPVGISFIGTAWSEPTLIKLAYALEQTLQARRPPQFLPTADLSAVCVRRPPRRPRPHRTAAGAVRPARRGAPAAPPAAASSAAPPAPGCSAAGLPSHRAAAGRTRRTASRRSGSE